ncbi:MAG: D-Ala-D-Ala carboxypeptidase family metallohydrolase, partial [Pseudomonadota bacterium]
PVAPTSSNAPAQVAAAPSNASGQQAQSGGLFNRLFSRNRAAPKPSAEVPSARTTVAASTTASSTPSAPRPTVVVASASGLPGVDRERVIGINKQDDERPVVQVASAAGLARLAPNGLRKQHSGVDVKCLKPALVRVLKQAERKFGKPVVVTSGYRSPRRNANARGAKNSLHMYCAAADVQIAGVSKWELAAYLRSMPGRGGVGTYCHTKSVHVDIGPKRDWNWRCRRG